MPTLMPAPLPVCANKPWTHTDTTSSSSGGVRTNSRASFRSTVIAAQSQSTRDKERKPSDQGRLCADLRFLQAEDPSRYSVSLKRIRSWRRAQAPTTAEITILQPHAIEHPL